MKEINDDILFFDGVCAVCNRLVNVMLRFNKNRRIYYAPLQGATAKRLLSHEYINDLNTVVFKHNNRIYKKSNAIIKILQTIGGIWTLAVVLYIIPRFLRDAVYVFIAKNRYKWFGKYESCRLPTEKEKAIILP